MHDTAASTTHRPLWLERFATPDPEPRRYSGFGMLAGLIEAWEERARFRWDLEQMVKANPHLIDDIGLTRRQAEAEIAKPFWQE